MEKFLLFVKLTCIKMSVESLMMRDLYVHSALFLISHKQGFASRKGLKEIWWKPAQVPRQLIKIIASSASSRQSEDFEDRGSRIWLFNGISWEALKILMPGPTLQNCDLTTLGCSQLFGISESSPSG